MLDRIRKHAGLYGFLQGLFIYAWVTGLAGTDSYISVYILWAVTGIFCVCDNLRTPLRYAGKTARWALVFSALFSAATLLANYRLFEPFTARLSLFQMACGFLGGLIVCLNVLICLADRLPLPGAAERTHPVRVFLFAFGSIAAVDLLYLLFEAYPGVLTRDSITTMQQILEGTYDNTMPFWHTMTVQVFVRLGLALFGDISAAVAFFHTAQILFLAACMAYGVVTLYQSGVSRLFLAAVFGLYILMPYHIVYSVTLWKDVLFGGAVLLFITAMYRLLKKLGKSQWPNYGMLLLGGMGTCLWRTNGWYAFLASTLVMLFLLKKEKRKILAVMGGILIVCWVLINPLLSALQVSKTDMVEAFAVPFQQIARVVAQGRELTPEETELLEMAFQLDKVPELYDPKTVDPIKFETFRYGNREYIGQHLTEYLKLYLRLGLKYPGDYLKAWVDETKGYWNGGYSFWIYTWGVSDNEMGITASGGGNAVGSLFRAIFRFLEQQAFFQPLFSIGLWAWAVMGCCLLNLWKKREEFLLTVPLLVLLAGLWLGSPVYAEFRYAYPVFLSTPVIVGVTVFRREQEMGCGL